MTRSDLNPISIVRMFPSGGLRLSAIVRGHLVSRRYFGYTQREARAQFVAEVRAPYVDLRDGEDA